MSDENASCWIAALQALLSTDGRTMRVLGAHRWSFSLGRPARWATAMLTDGWLVLEAAFAADCRDPGELLARNADLGAAVKVALCGEPPHCRAVAELRADTVVDVPRRLALALRNLGRATGGFGSDGAEGIVPDVASVDLRTLCGEGGWPCTARSETSVAVDLSAADDFWQAVVNVHAGEARAFVDLAVADVPDSASRTALCLLLLRTSGAVRMARAVGGAPGGPWGFEVVWAGTPDATALHHGLVALAVCCRSSAREAQAVAADAGLAAAYLRSSAVAATAAGLIGEVCPSSAAGGRISAQPETTQRRMNHGTSS